MAIKQMTAGTILAVLLLCGCGNPFLLEGVETTPSGSAAEETTVPAGSAEQSAAEPETQQPEQPEPEPEPEPEPLPLEGKVVCLDPGHGITSESKSEAVSPLSGETKPAYVSGASGEHQTEEELNLAVAKYVKIRLEKRGATVVMTRETHEAAVSNIERAQIANDAEADLCIRIHADGAEGSSAHGISTLIPAGSLLGTPEITEPSREAAVCIQNALVKATGAQDRGLVERSDLTGFNWSEVPVVLVEMGFLSNPEEDQKLSTEKYRKQVADGIADGAQEWLAAQPE